MTALTAQTVTLKLETPIKIGDNEIAEVELRRPKAGEMRGLQMNNLMMSDYESMATLASRISTPTLANHVIAQMDPSDFMTMCGEIMSFLLPKDLRPQI